MFLLFCLRMLWRHAILSCSACCHSNSYIARLGVEGGTDGHLLNLAAGIWVCHTQGKDRPYSPTPQSMAPQNTPSPHGTPLTQGCIKVFQAPAPLPHHPLIFSTSLSRLPYVGGRYRGEDRGSRA